MRVQRPGISCPRAWVSASNLDHIDAAPVALSLRRMSPLATTLVCSYMLFAEVLEAPSDVQEGIVVPWICFFAIATVVSVVSLIIKAAVFLQQLRERRRSLTDLLDEETACAQKLKKHRQRLHKTKREIWML